MEFPDFANTFHIPSGWKYLRAILLPDDEHLRPFLTYAPLAVRIPRLSGWKAVIKTFKASEGSQSVA
jgi:hypothetical protein